MLPGFSRLAPAAVLLAACSLGGPSGSDPGGLDGKGDGPDIELPPGTRAVLEIYALDVWGQPLPSAESSLSVARNGVPVEHYGSPVAWVPLLDAGSYQIDLTAPDHHALRVDVEYLGGSTLDGASFRSVGGDERGGLSFSHDLRRIAYDGSELPVHTAYLGLRHRWFAPAGPPARRGNRIELLMDGEQAWAAVSEELRRARESILLATWWWESDHELVRGDDFDEDQREANTILRIVEDSPALKRVIISQFWRQDGPLAHMSSDAEVRAHGDDPGDGFELMGQANETYGRFGFAVDPVSFGARVRAIFASSANRAFEEESPLASVVPPHDVDLTQWPIGLEVQHASYHQKFMVLDDETAFVGGMNLRANDWDSSEHRVFDPRRMRLGAREWERQAVRDKTAKPDHGPRKDYMLRIEGPAAQDVADTFENRWALLRQEGGVYSENTTPFEVSRGILPRSGGLEVQVTTTLPEPFWKHAIAETWFNAVANAERFIYIEDQYFRIPMLVDAILARMRAVAELQLVVITKPINEWTDPGCEWTYRTAERIRAEFPDRFVTLQVRSFDVGPYVCTEQEEENEWWLCDGSVSKAHFENVDVHSKMLIVDDVFMSVGSANKNNRGLVYDAEMNVAIVDPIWVSQQRRRILANLLPPGAQVFDSPAGWIGQLRDAARSNDEVYERWDDRNRTIELRGAPVPEDLQPAGLLYELRFRDPNECLIEGVGPDMT